MDDFLQTILDIANFSLRALRRVLLAIARWSPVWAPMFFIVWIARLAKTIFRAGGLGLPPIDVIQRFAGWVIPLLVSSLALGFLVMAIIQLMKAPLRAAFHRYELLNWLRYYRDGFGYEGYPPFGYLPRNEDPEHFQGRPVFRNERWSSVFSNLRRGEYQAMLELPLEQLAAQIQAEAELNLTLEETRYSEERVLANERSDYIYRIQRSIDAFQIRVRSRWRRCLQILALGISLVLSILVATALDLWEANLLGTAFLVMITSVFGAFFSAVARDIVAVLDRLRR